MKPFIKKKYLKYAIGITKYASNTLTLGELGRFPIQIKTNVSAILYWLRDAHGTENIMLNAAFQTMRSDKNTWLQNVQNILLTNGLGNVWHNPERWEKDQLKHILTQKLQDVFIQQYRAYLNDEVNSDKCLLAKMCDKGVYNKSHYLLNVKSPQITSIIAKYRLNVNLIANTEVSDVKILPATYVDFVM